MDCQPTDCLLCRRPGNLCNLTSQEYEDAARKLSTLITIQIQANNSLPCYICQDCIGTLNEVFNFLQRCRAAVQRLQEEELLRRQAVKTYAKLEMTISSIRKEPVDTIEDEQLLHENVSGHCTSEVDLAEAEMDLDEDRNDISLEDAKLVEPALTDEDTDKTFFCETSGSGFEKNSEPRQHMKTHTKDRFRQTDQSFSCQSCPKSSTCSHSLGQPVEGAHSNRSPTTHKTVHLDATCTICGKKWRNKATLDRHLRTHTKEKPFECNECDKKFCQNSSLSRHRLIHSDKWPYKCNLCNKVFRLKIDLENHELVHNRRKLYECTICKKVLLYRRSLIQHMRVHIPELVETEILTVIEEEGMSEQHDSREVIGQVKEDEC